MPVWPCLFPIMWGDSTLLAHESDSSLTPYIHVQFTKAGETTYNFYTTDYILQVDIHQDPFRDDGKIILANYDQHFKNIDLRDYKATIKFGLTVSTVNYSRTIAPFWVSEQSFTSREGKLVCSLSLKGMLSKLKDDRASTPLIGTGSTAKTMVNSILTAGLSCYSHCTARTVIWHGDSGLDSITLYMPSDVFAIELGTTRADAVRQLLDLGASFMRPEEDEKIHMRIPKTTGTDYDHEFALDGHVFFFNNRNDRIIVPNYISVTCDTTTNPPYNDKVTYTGYAQDDTSYNLYPVKYFHRAYGLFSNDEATAISEGILENVRQTENYGEAEVPMAFYLNVLDYIKATDIRENTTTVGNVGSIDWHYFKKKYRQTIGVGGWWNRRKTQSFVQDYIEEPMKREFSFWSSVTLPATKLADGQTINMSTFIIPHYRRLFVKHYSITDSGTPVTSRGNWETSTAYYLNEHVYYRGIPVEEGTAYACTADHTSSSSTEPGVGALWATVWSLYTSPTKLHFATGDGTIRNTFYAGGAEWQGTPIEVEDSFTAGGSPFMFYVEANGAAADKVTAQVDFTWQYLGGSLP